ncbi:hypothetical protein QZH41_005929 [Actinostola sp. cb2023]|nr:hypothetical protein QZH41_005929 [Actinostola sp. cb2023]
MDVLSTTATVLASERNNMTNSSGIVTAATTNATAIEVVFEPLFMRIIRLAIYLIIFLIATFGNSLVIFVVYKTRELHTDCKTDPTSSRNSFEKS